MQFSSPKVHHLLIHLSKVEDFLPRIFDYCLFLFPYHHIVIYFCQGFSVSPTGLCNLCPTHFTSNKALIQTSIRKHPLSVLILLKREIVLYANACKHMRPCVCVCVYIYLCVEGVVDMYGNDSLTGTLKTKS